MKNSLFMLLIKYFNFLFWFDGNGKIYRNSITKNNLLNYDEKAS